MSGSPTYKELMGDGFVPSDSLGLSPCHQIDLQSEFIDWNNAIDAELSLDQFQDISNNFTEVDESLEIDFSDFFQEAPTGGIVVRDGSLVDWCDQLNQSQLELGDSGLGPVTNDHNVNTCPLPQEDLFMHSLYEEDCLNFDTFSEVDAISVNSEVGQTSEQAFQDRRFDFLTQTKMQFDSSDSPSTTKRRKKNVKKYPSPDDDYEVDEDEDDEDDDSDYECWSRSKKSKRKSFSSKRKRSAKCEEGGYDCESKKRRQNKKAAMKYRDKKKKEDAENEAILEQLNRRNAELRRQKEEKEHELQVLKRLFEGLTKKPHQS